ncbi:NAP1-related protein 2 [Physcomitrium patens]
MDKGKRAKVEEEEGSELDAELVQAIEKLQEVQDELERVNEEASDKVLEVEQFYNEIRRPVYSKRNAIIHNIPDFWLTAFLSHPVLCDLLTEDDQKVFKYLESLDVEDFKDVKSGYSISFNFRTNPYFEDTKLTKEFRFSDDGSTSVSGTQPKWKDGMNLTNGVVAEKEGNKRGHQTEDRYELEALGVVGWRMPMGWYCGCRRSLFNGCGNGFFGASEQFVRIRNGSQMLCKLCVATMVTFAVPIQVAFLYYCPLPLLSCILFNDADAFSFSPLFSLQASLFRLYLEKNRTPAC